MYCRQCGNFIPNGEKFCRNCGNDVLNTDNNTNTNPNPNPSSYDVPQIVSTYDEEKNKKKHSFINKILIGLFVVCFCFTFCISHVSFKNQNRVIMIYMVGADLESKGGIGSRDLEDLKYSKVSSHHTKVLLMAGGSTVWKNDYIDSTETSIYYLGPNGFEKVESRDLNNMGSSDNLSYFLNYVNDHYSADKYDLIFWNHGGAVDGSEYDSITHDHLSLVEMKEAFEKGPFKGNHKLEVLSFHTCLNSTIELASIYQEYAHYLVASEEVTYGSLVDSSLRFINDIHAKDSGFVFGRKLIGVYVETIDNVCAAEDPFYIRGFYCVDLTYSIIDLSKISKINASFDLFSGDLSKSLSTKFSDFSKKRAKFVQFGEDDLSYDMVDMYDFVNQFGAFSSHAKDVENAIDDAVLYHYSNMDNSHGISLYFPYNSEIFMSFYPKISVSKNYLQFVQSFSNYRRGYSGHTNFSSFSGSNSIVVNDKKDKYYDVELNLNDEQIENLTNVSYMVFEDGMEEGYYRFAYYGKSVDILGNTLKASIKGRLLTIFDKDFPEDSISLKVFEEKVTDEYVDLSCDILFENYHSYSDITYGTLYYRIDKDHPNGYIKNITVDYDTDDNTNSGQNEFSVFAPIVVKATDFDDIGSLSYQYKIMDENGKFNPNWLDDKTNYVSGYVLWTHTFDIKMNDLQDDKQYYVIFIMKDIGNNTYYSDPIPVKK